MTNLHFWQRIIADLTCIVALSTLLDRAAAAAAEALVEPTPGLPPDCALLGDVIRSLARLGAAGARARGVLADLERDPDLVLVHAPFVLARLSAPFRTRTFGCIWIAETVNMWLTPSSMHFASA